MARSNSTLIYWIRTYLKRFAAQIDALIAIFIASIVALSLALSSIYSWGNEKNASRIAIDDDRRTNDLTMQALSVAADPNEIVWLESAGHRFLNLYRPAINATQMAIILLPGQLSHMADGGLLKTLYNELPHSGWSCLLAALPVQNRTQNDQLKNDERHQEGLQRADQAIDYAMADGAGSTTLIADRLSVQIAIETAIARSDITSGLVLWQLHSSQLPREKLQQLAQSQITLLDILPSGLSRHDKINRQRQFQLAGFGKNYRQFSPPSGEAAIRYSSRRIREWAASEFKKNI
tara:strand:+ start:5510 stop:6385 length:876 start_codon:yes stop_codon:yes gene_type:complete